MSLDGKRFDRFNGIFGYRMSNLNRLPSPSAICCPVCATSSVHIEDFSNEQKAIFFRCLQGHHFALTFCSDKTHVDGFWEVATGSRETFRDLPTQKQFDLVENISQRLGISNPWSEAGILFPEENSEEGLPFFMSSGVTLTQISFWISSHIHEYEKHGKKTSSSDRFIVWRVLKRNGECTIGYSPEDEKIPKGASVWVGPDILDTSTSTANKWIDRAIYRWSKPLPDDLIEERRRRFPGIDVNTEEGRLFAGEWMRWPFSEHVSKSLYCRRSYRKAQNLARACSLFEIDNGRNVQNPMPELNLNEDSFEVLVRS